MPKSLTELKKGLKGIVPVQICPYTREGEVDLEGFKENTEFLLDFAKKGKDVVIMTNGSTTESYANSIEEQREIIKTVAGTVAGQVPVIAGVSQPAPRRTIELARYAAEAGADCAMLTAPYYHHGSKEGVYQYYKTVAGAVDTGIMVYNNPDVAGVLIPVDLSARLAKINNIVAMKDNSPLAADYASRAAMIAAEDMVLINGLGELCYLGSAVYGLRYRGFVSFLANFAPQLSYAIYEAAEAGDFKRAHEALNKTFPLWAFMDEASGRRQSISVFPEWLRAPTMFVSVCKEAMNMVGLRGGFYHRTQLPIEDLTDGERQELREALKEMGVL